MKKSDFPRCIVIILSVFLFFLFIMPSAFGQSYNTFSLRDDTPYKDLSIEELHKQINLAWLYNKEGLITLLQEGVRRSDPDSQFKLGYCYLIGKQMPVDYEESFYWYKKAADQSYPKAYYDIGAAYYYGRGITKDKEMAVKYYTASYDSSTNNSDREMSARTLGRIYSKENAEKAIEWFKKAADIHYESYGEIDELSNESLKELGVDYNPATRSTNYTRNTYASRSSSSKSSTQKSNSSQRTSSRPINWATDVIMPPIIDYSNIPFNSVGTYPVGGGYSGTIDGGSYNSGGAGNSSNSASRCTWCNGTGKVVKNDNAPANFGISKPKQRCPECGEIYDPNVRNHYHQTCSHCHGTGLR